MEVSYAPPESPEGIVTITLTETEAKILAARSSSERARWGVRAQGYNAMFELNNTIRGEIKKALDLQ